MRFEDQRGSGSQTPRAGSRSILKTPCEVRNAVPVTSERSLVLSAIDGVLPGGQTPLARALREVARDLASSPSRARASVILITDGQETCESGASVLNAAHELGVMLHLLGPS